MQSSKNKRQNTWKKKLFENNFFKRINIGVFFNWIILLKRLKYKIYTCIFCLIVFGIVKKLMHKVKNTKKNLCFPVLGSSSAERVFTHITRTFHTILWCSLGFLNILVNYKEMKNLTSGALASALDYPLPHLSISYMQ